MKWMYVYMKRGRMSAYIAVICHKKRLSWLHSQYTYNLIYIKFHAKYQQMNERGYVCVCMLFFLHFIFDQFFFSRSHCSFIFRCFFLFIHFSFTKKNTSFVCHRAKYVKMFACINILIIGGHCISDIGLTHLILWMCRRDGGNEKKVAHTENTFRNMNCYSFSVFFFCLFVNCSSWQQMLPFL